MSDSRMVEITKEQRDWLEDFRRQQPGSIHFSADAITQIIAQFDNPPEPDEGEVCGDCGEAVGVVWNAPELRADYEKVENERDLLRPLGDGLQSAASRLAEWVSTRSGEVPYEVRMASLEAQSAVEAWTVARKQAALTRAEKP